MTQKRLIYALVTVGLVSAISLLLIINTQTPPQSDEPSGEATDVPLVVPFESNGFRFVYPEGWRHNIPQTNILFLGSPDVLQQQPGASMVVQRSIGLAIETKSLEEALERYLERGPLRSVGAWTVVESISETTFAGRDAVIVALEGADGTDAIPMHSEIVVTRADNKFIYVFATSAPLEQWETVRSTFGAILASVTILE